MNDRNFEKLKKIEIELLLSFIEITKKYNLKYFLLGGTCLGAVRHNGFIPWDDDIDVGMPREDYEVFLKVAQAELPENVFLQNGNTDPEYTLNFAKLRNSDTTFMEQSFKNYKINHGVYIDVFPLDGYKNSFVTAFWDKIFTYRIICEQDWSHLNNFKKIIMTIIKVVLMTIYPDSSKIRDKRERLINKIPYNDSENVHNFCGAWGKKEVMPKSYFGNGIKGKFEEIEVILPEQYDLYLTNLYGNYMELPPINKRVSHHRFEKIDLDNSYKNYSERKG